tara:strand:+ start:461 stop:1837 length:1377 start_codon:yes stop_codon:yes gene_type:complete
MQFSIVKKSKLDDVVFRLDAEYYHPSHLDLEKKLEKKPTKSIENAKGIFDCSAFYPSIVQYYRFDKKGIPFIRVNEIKNGLLNITKDTAFLPKQILDENSSTIAKCNVGDIIIAKGGNSLAKVALLTNEYKSYALSRDVIVLRTQNIKDFNRYYLWMFLHSSIGKQMLLRTASQTGQPHLTLEALYKLELPLYSTKFQNKFEELYYDSKNLKLQSIKKYIEAQNIVLDDLGLKNFLPSHKISFIKNFSDIDKAGRIDAEYFHPKYDELTNTIKASRGGWDSLSNLVNFNDRSFTPKDEKTYKYIELTNIADYGEIMGCTVDKGKNLPSRARLKVNTGDVIISSIEGSIASIAMIDDEYNNALCSTGFHVISSYELNSETLLVILKSIAGQLQLKKGCSGTILTAINQDELKKIILPKISKPKQEKIKNKIIKSLKLLHKSKHTLEKAKDLINISIKKK